MKIVTIIGARPQFIKAAVVSRAIANYNKDVTSNSFMVTDVIVHTGQHYDRNMSDIFFEEMNIPRPNYFLDINGLSHGAMTGQMLEKIEAVLIEEKPDVVLVYGDTNTHLPAHWPRQSSILRSLMWKRDFDLSIAKCRKK